MKKRFKLIILSLLLIVTSFSFLFAWFILVEKTTPFIITSAKVNLTTALYQVEGQTETSIDSITIYEVIPKNSFTYKLTVKNEGTVTTNLEIKFNFKASKESLKDFILFEIEDLADFDDSLDFSENIYSYYAELAPSAEITIYFYVLISEDLELTDLSGNDYVEIENIEITLQQKPEV